MAGRQIAPPHLPSEGLRCRSLRFFNGSTGFDARPAVGPDPAPGPQDGDVPEQRRRNIDAVVARHVGLRVDAVQMCQRHGGPPQLRLCFAARQVQLLF